MKKKRNDEPCKINPSVALRLADKLVPLLKHFRVARSANRYIKTQRNCVCTLFSVADNAGTRFDRAKRVARRDRTFARVFFDRA